MSQLDSGMDIFASPLSPLKQSLIGAMPNTFEMQPGGTPGTIADTSGGPFTAAHNYGRARVRGSKTPGAGPTGGGTGPMDDHVAMMAMISAANLSDDEKSQVKDFKNTQQLKDYLAVRHQAMAQKPAVNLGQMAAQGSQGAVDVTTGPQGTGPGTMSVTAGRGNRPDRPDVKPMTKDALQQWGQNVAQDRQANHTGSELYRVQTPDTPFSPGMPAGMNLTHNPQGQIVGNNLRGFEVKGGAMNAPQQQGGAPTGLAGTLQEMGANPAHVKSMTDNGVSLKDAIEISKSHSRQEETDRRSAQKEKQQEGHQGFTENSTVLNELVRRRGLLAKRAEEDADPNIRKDMDELDRQIGNVSGRMAQHVTPNAPQRSQPAPNPGQLPGQNPQVNFAGHSFQIGKPFQGPDGKQYVLSGKMHSDGTPEISAAQ